MTVNDTQLSTHLWLVMMKAYQPLREHAMRNIETSGLCMSDFTTLEVLLHKGPLPVNVIGEKVQLTSGSITTAVDRLEKKGLVERQFSPTDRRVRLVNLTLEGRSLIETVFAAHEQALETAASGLNPEEKKQLIELLKKLGKEANRLLENA
ncbi:MAG: transcriptional regulator, MarR family [Vampirovibrio sp.]|jgi:MarR family 2-MHQ and catechol resistance regulon transcriptional repressor|nr:transcriptional regulator, MarR family [Vampirovibrio sp.]